MVYHTSQSSKCRIIWKKIWATFTNFGFSFSEFFADGLSSDLSKSRVWVAWVKSCFIIATCQCCNTRLSSLNWLGLHILSVWFIEWRSTQSKLPVSESTFWNAKNLFGPLKSKQDHTVKAEGSVIMCDSPKRILLQKQSRTGSYSKRERNYNSHCIISQH